MILKNYVKQLTGRINGLVGYQFSTEKRKFTASALYTFIKALKLRMMFRKVTANLFIAELLSRLSN